MIVIFARGTDISQAARRPAVHYRRHALLLSPPLIGMPPAIASGILFSSPITTHRALSPVTTDRRSSHHQA